MPRPRRIVVLGASAGGIDALVKVIGRLPATIGCPVLVVLHLAPTGKSVLPEILARATQLNVCPAGDGDELLADHVYVGVPDRHLLVEDGHVRLARTPLENGHRPAIDVTMRTAARSFGAGAVGVVLSGARDDGTAGLLAIKEMGGTAAAQDPEDALYAAMPSSAARHVELDAVLAARDLGDWLARVCASPDDGGAAMIHPPLEHELRPDRRPEDADDPRDTVSTTRGDATRFTCPDCGGVLFEHEHGTLLRFRCSVGHAFSVDSLSDEQSQAVEDALWTAVRTLEDRIVLLGGLADRARAAGQVRSAALFDHQGRALAARSHTVRGAIEQLALPAEVA